MITCCETLMLSASDGLCSVIEIHMFLVTLMRQFEFTLPDNAPRVKRWRPGFLLPIVEGEEHKGPQLPLKVTPLMDR